VVLLGHDGGGRGKKVLGTKYKTANGLFSWENARNEIFGEEQSTTHGDRKSFTVWMHDQHKGG